MQKEELQKIVNNAVEFASKALEGLPDSPASSTAVAQLAGALLTIALADQGASVQKLLHSGI